MLVYINERLRATAKAECEHSQCDRNINGISFTKRNNLLVTVCE